jgi:tetratricopeptide (TPR) repeat protein
MLDSLGQALTASGQYDEAIDAYRRSLQQVRELGDPWGESIVLSNLGTALREAGRLDEAAASWQQALTVMDENGIADGHEVSRDRVHEQLEELDPQRAQA